MNYRTIGMISGALLFGGYALGRNGHLLFAVYHIFRAMSILTHGKF